MKKPIPIKGALLTVGFICVINALGQYPTWPISNSDTPDDVTSAFGPRYDESRPFDYDMHEGIDISAYYQPVHCTNPGNGYVVDYGDEVEDPWGLYLAIYHEDDGSTTWYLHLSLLLVELYDVVDHGQVIAISGNTGHSYGPHLHYSYFPSGGWYTVNPLHNLPYSNMAVPIIEDNLFIQLNYDYSLNYMWWVVNYSAYDLDFNHMTVHLYTADAGWVSDTVDYDERKNCWSYYFDFNDGRGIVYCIPYQYYHPSDKRIEYYFVADINAQIYAPIADNVGIVLDDISFRECPDCDGIPMPGECWWGNPECHSPVIGISSFDAELSNGVVLLSWVLHTTLGISGFNIWKAENIDGPFIKITEAPLPASKENGRYLFLDPNIEEGHEYFYKLQLVLHDSTEVFLDDMIASTGIISILPMSISLKSIYPNPFNNYTLITFTVGDGETDQIELTVFNMLGQKVRCLANGLVTPGNYTLLFDGLNDFGQQLASGVYLVNMKCGSYFKTKKISILR